jgi:16S rRNA (uracil1498-N3)-methyltransferase
MHWFYEPDFGLVQTLSQETKRHLTSLRVSAAEEFVVTDGKGSSWQVQADSGDVISAEQLQVAALPAVGFTLVQALAKSDRDELALQASVELGATEIVPWQAGRSIVRWDAKAERNRERWQAIAVESMKQSQRPWLAEVLPLATTKQLKPKGIGLVLDPRASLTLNQVPAAEHYTVVVGPEGGISSEEIDALVANGFSTVRLGHGVLRASTAGPAAIAAIQLLHGEFRS